MDYVTQLSDEELTSICNYISGNTIKGFFANHQAEFTKLRPGFRVKKMPDEEIIRLVVENKDKFFINGVLNNKVEELIAETDEKVRFYRENGNNESQAFAMALTDSAFKEYPGVYFQLSAHDYTQDYINTFTELFLFYMSEMSQKEDTVSSLSDRLISEADEKEALSLQLDHAQSDLKECRQRKNEESKCFQNEIDILHDRLKEYSERRDADSALIKSLQGDIKKKEQEMISLQTREIQALSEIERLIHESEHLKDELLSAKKQIAEGKVQSKSLEEQLQSLIKDRNIPHPTDPSIVTDGPASILYKSAYMSPVPMEEQEIEYYESLEEQKEHVAFELEEAGVAGYVSNSLAVYLLSAYYSNTPVLLVGPNGADIADAFSAAVHGELAATLDCNMPYSYEAISECLNSDSLVIKVLNPFTGNWSGAITNILTRGNAFYILTHPYKEDLLIEPKSILNYMAPIYTDSLIDGFAQRQFGRSMGTFPTDAIRKTRSVIRIFG